MTDKEKLKLKIEEQRQLIRPKNTGEMKAVDTPTPLEQGWLNALKWMDELVDSLPEEPVEQDSELEEACDSYYNETWDEHGGRAMVVDGCHDIWFPSHATDDFFKSGANWQKAQMMKDAVGGYVIEDIEEGNGDFLLSADYIPASMGLKDQQKVKVIVLKYE